ncbi:hypothetical protein [Saccharophagus degradans]|uniref:Uncharacterized protein n=1 Tax=Saccharophagus degradans (strain 2-40 / ATCC 43961 / DSM 17024) TaxID=203122 RepID=Q21P35_SACD2|nr:hypothetical protein [Saccharophagus degradans]ABD79544.1 hypothetical protein Sde_0280 [Saccharophagus degradans 2-40]
MKNWIVTLLFSGFILATSVHAFSATTTVVLETPKPALIENRIYERSDIFDEHTTTTIRGVTQTNYIFKPQLNDWKATFSDNTEINKYFIKEFVNPRQELLDKFRQDIEEESAIQKLHYAVINQKPMNIILGVRGSKVTFELSGIELKAKVSAHTEGAADIFCGSSATGTIGVDIKAVGEYDVNTGFANIIYLDFKESIDIDCSNLFGKLFDFALDYTVDYFVDEAVNEFLQEVFSESMYVGGFKDIFSDELLQAGDYIGFDVVTEAWDALSTYVDGVTFEINVGVDYYSTGNHLLAFKVYQEKTDFDLSKSGSAWKKISYASFDCPDWATSLKLYEASRAITGYKHSLRGPAVPIYGGVEFNRVSVNGLVFETEMSCSGRLCGSSTDTKFGFVASCESPTGIWSYQSHVGML